MYLKLGSYDAHSITTNTDLKFALFITPGYWTGTITTRDRSHESHILTHCQYTGTLVIYAKLFSLFLLYSLQTTAFSHIHFLPSVVMSLSVVLLLSDVVPYQMPHGRCKKVQVGENGLNTNSVIMNKSLSVFFSSGAIVLLCSLSILSIGLYLSVSAFLH